LDRSSFSNGNHVNEKKEEEEKRPYKCTYDGCNKSFAKSSRLKRHSVTHNENRERFYCTKEDCNRSYGTKYDLVAHQKQKHSKDSKPYKCNFGSCEATFESKKMLDRHKLEHMKEGDYEFSHLVFSISGTLSKKRVEFVKLIHEHGAQFVSSVTHKVTHLISTPSDVSAESSQVKEAKKRGVFIVSEDFVFRSIELGRKADEAEFTLSDHIDFTKLPLRNLRKRSKDSDDSDDGNNSSLSEDKDLIVKPPKRTKLHGDDEPSRDITGFLMNNGIHNPLESVLDIASELST